MGAILCLPLQCNSTMQRALSLSATRTYKAPPTRICNDVLNKALCQGIGKSAQWLRGSKRPVKAELHTTGCGPKTAIFLCYPTPRATSMQFWATTPHSQHLTTNESR
jgi:hypothetical protein